MMTKRIINFPSSIWQHPLAEIDFLARQMDNLTSRVLGRSGIAWFPAGAFPAVNITEDEERYFVRAELPGIKSEEIDLQVDGRTLTISGERKRKSYEDNARYHRKEREDGRFSRVIELPGDIQAERVDAKMVNGVLTVAILKSEDAKPKKITIN
jgi:HSP20 family protein